MNFLKLPLLGLLFVCSWNHPLYSAAEPGAMDSIKKFLVQGRYSSADLVDKELLIENPFNIEALYLGCAIWQMEILDYESYNVEAERYLNYADSAFSRLSRALPRQKGKDSVDCLFYMGSILGSIGVVKAKTGNWPGAIKKAFASAKYFKQVVKLDSAYYPGYYGIGVFNYYLSTQLKWLPFFGDNRIEAIRQLRKSTRSAFPYNYAACNSLCWIYIERGRFDEADSLASSVLSDFPDNTLFLRIKMRIDLAKRRWRQALSCACRLVELSSQRTPKNWADIVSGYQALISSYDNLAKGAESLRAAITILSLKLPDHVKEIAFVKKHLRFIEDVRKKYTARQPASTVNIPSSSGNQAVWHSEDCQGF